MKVTDLKAGMLFKIGSQRKYRTFSKCIILEKGTFIGPEIYTGKCLVILADCRQMLLNPDTEVQTKEAF